MVLKTYDTQGKPQLVTKPLTPASFAKFGDIISANHQIGAQQQSSANYGTAVKVHKVSKVNNHSLDTPSGKVATANWNIFRCSPPNHLFTKDGADIVYLSKVLERHPFSTQTFLPMGCDKEKDAYIVICAQSKEDDSLPDPDSLEAFICKGDQAVTYGAGTWHAPMVSLIPNLDFGVLIHENGVPEEDCQECYFMPGYDVVIKSSPKPKVQSKFQLSSIEV